MSHHAFALTAAALILVSTVRADAAAPGADVPVNPRANQLFDRDPELKQWALRLYDRNRDGWLTLYEAQPALAAFRDIADGNRDGRVTTAEYSRAKQFIAARY